MSLRRAANSTPRHAVGGVQWAGNTPWRSPQQLGESLPKRPQVAAALLPRRQAGDVSDQQEALPRPGLLRKVLVPTLPGGTLCCSWGTQCVHMQPAPSRAQGVQSWLSLSWELGTSLDTEFCGAEPQGGPCLSPAAPRGVCGEGLSQPCPRHPL